MPTTQQQAFELGMHSTFKSAGIKNRRGAEALFKHAGVLLAQRRAAATSQTAFELGLRKVAADHGLLGADEQDAFVEAARKVAAEKSANQYTGRGAAALTLASLPVLGGAAAGSGIGQLAGAFRAKDKDEGRLHAILRSQGTGAATGAGAGAGLVAGSLLGTRRGAALAGHLPMSKARMVAILAAALGGGAGAHLLAKRTPNPPGILDQIKTKITKKAGFLGLREVSAGEDVGSIGKGIKGLAGKAKQGIKDHPTIAAALAALVAGGLVGSHVQKRRDQNKLAAGRFLIDQFQKAKDQTASGAQGIADSLSPGIQKSQDGIKSLRDYIMAKLGK